MANLDWLYGRKWLKEYHKQEIKNMNHFIRENQRVVKHMTPKQSKMFRKDIEYYKATRKHSRNELKRLKGVI
jgi:hypothetical protein